MRIRPATRETVSDTNHGLCGIQESFRAYQKNEVGGIRYEARSRGRSSPNSLVFLPKDIFIHGISSWV